jgi:hypothetical protein
MDPEIGRFISRDTIGLWGDPNNLGNGQAYVGNNPWTGLDPYGEDGRDYLDMSAHEAFNHAFAYFTGGIFESLFGGRTDSDEEEGTIVFTPPDDGLGGAYGAAANRATLGVVPFESNPTPISATAGDMAAGFFVIVNPAMNLVHGENVTHGQIDRREEAVRLLLDFGITGLSIAGTPLRGTGDAERVVVRLRFKPGWTVEQRAEALEKVRTLNEARAVITPPQRGTTSARSRYVSAGSEVNASQDVDHIVDLQLGGHDTLVNLTARDRSVNRSLGSQIYHATKDLPDGAIVDEFVIGDF